MRQFRNLAEYFLAKKDEVKILEETQPQQMYLEDLSELKKKYKWAGSI